MLKDERGAVAVLTAFGLVIIMAVAATVIDIGTLRVARTDMQSLADVVSLDVVRDLDGRSVAQLQSVVDADAAVSIARNLTTVGSRPTAAVQLGQLSASGSFVALASGTPTAVKVTIATVVGFAFAAFVGRGSGSAARSAVASKEASACYTIGSYAASIDSTDSVLLDPLFKQLAQQTGAFSDGYAVGQAVGYQGLVVGSVKLGDLAVALGLGTVQALATSTVTAAKFFAGLKAAYAAGGTGGNASTVTMLGVLASKANSNVSVDVAKIVGIDSGTGSLADLRANLLDLVWGAMTTINGTNVASLNIAGTLPGIANANAQVTLIQGAHLYCGLPGSTFTTAGSSATQQLSARVTASFNPSTQTVSLPTSSLLPVGGTLTAPVPSYVDTTVSVAPTASTLTAISCSGGAKGIDLAVTNSLATAAISNLQLSEATVDTKITLLGVTTAVRIRVGTANANVNVTMGAAGSSPFTIRVPPQAYDTAYPTRTGTIGMTFSLNSTPYVEAIPLINGIPVYPALNLTGAVQTQLANIVAKAVLSAQFSATASSTAIINSLVVPLLGLAGVRLAGSDATLLSSPALQCGAPRLRG